MSEVDGVLTEFGVVSVMYVLILKGITSPVYLLGTFLVGFPDAASAVSKLIQQSTLMVHLMVFLIVLAASSRVMKNYRAVLVTWVVGVSVQSLLGTDFIQFLGWATLSVVLYSGVVAAFAAFVWYFEDSPMAETSLANAVRSTLSDHFGNEPSGKTYRGDD